MCKGHTRLYKLALIVLKELSVSHVWESGLKSTFVFLVASYAEVFSGARISLWERRYVFPVLEGFGQSITISNHMMMQTMPNLKLKPHVSRRKLKCVLKLNDGIV